VAAERQFSTFYLDRQYFGIDVLKVQEIIGPQSMTRVPLAPPVVRGLINLRGQIVTAIDLRRRLDMRERSEDERPVNVIVQSDDGAVSLLVDEIGDVLDVPDELFDPPPDMLMSKARDVILGAYKLDQRLMLVLDVAKVLRFPTLRD
jgi:purine-binding chemotaxis protein CheW